MLGPKCGLLLLVHIWQPKPLGVRPLHGSELMTGETAEFVCINYSTMTKKFNYKDIQGGQKLEKVPFLSHQSIVPLPYNQGACHRSKFGPPPLINRTLCSEASYPLLKTAREDCANGDMPATVSPTWLTGIPQKMEYAKKPCKDERCNLSKEQGVQREVSD